MKLYAISDLHLAHPANRAALEQLPAFPEDWLILAGDVAETVTDFSEALAILSRRFARVIWVPGNHDLWTLPNRGTQLRGDSKYRYLVEICHRYGVLTPEDPYVTWPGAADEALLVPTFLLYDYSFRPDNVPFEEALDWAAEHDIICTDEQFLHPDPYPSLPAWCEARCEYTEERLASLPQDKPLILINHYPLRQDLVYLPRIPRFSLWCGTRRTEPWLDRFPIKLAIYGHLHIRTSTVRDGVRFEEVSLGYPRQWQTARGLAHYLREITW